MQLNYILGQGEREIKSKGKTTTSPVAPLESKRKPALGWQRCITDKNVSLSCSGFRSANKAEAEAFLPTVTAYSLESASYAGCFWQKTQDGNGSNHQRERCGRENMIRPWNLLACITLGGPGLKTYTSRSHSCHLTAQLAWKLSLPQFPSLTLTPWLWRHCSASSRQAQKRLFLL